VSERLRNSIYFWFKTLLITVFFFFSFCLKAILHLSFICLCLSVHTYSNLSQSWSIANDLNNKEALTRACVCFINKIQAKHVQIINTRGVHSTINDKRCIKTQQFQSIDNLAAPLHRPFSTLLVLTTWGSTLG